MQMIPDPAPHAVSRLAQVMDLAQPAALTPAPRLPARDPAQPRVPWYNLPPAGLLFTAKHSGPLDLAPPVSYAAISRQALSDAAAAAQASSWAAARYLVSPPQDYRAAAHSLPILDAFLTEQDEAGSIGTLFVRFTSMSTVPMVASSRLDTLQAMGQNAAALHHFLCAPASQEAFVRANGPDALQDAKQQAVQFYNQAHKELLELTKKIMGNATARIQDFYLKSDPALRDREKLSEGVRRQLALHDELLAWRHGPSVRGPLQNTPISAGAWQGWQGWRSQLLRWVALLPSTEMLHQVIEEDTNAQMQKYFADKMAELSGELFEEQMAEISRQFLAEHTAKLLRMRENGGWGDMQPGSLAAQEFAAWLEQFTTSSTRTSNLAP